MNHFGLRLAVLAASLVLAWPASAALSVKAEVNPNPAQPGETVDLQITVASTSTSGSLVVRLLWPAAMDGLTPFTTGGAACVGSCNTGELLSWNLGTLAAGSTVTVGFAETLPAGLASGTTIPFQLELLEGGVSRLVFIKSIEVQADSPLELAIDPSADPVRPSSQLTYELVYGNTSNLSAENGELSLLLPAGTQFLAATGNGILVGGRVVWDLGSVTAGSGGRERVTVAVGALASGTLLAVEDASLAADLNFLPKVARAEAVTRVAPPALQVKLEADADPLAPGELIDLQLVVANPAAQATGSLVLRMWWPEELDSSTPFTIGAGACVGSCNSGELLEFNLGSLPPFSTRVVSINEDSHSLANGRLIPLEIELAEANRTTSSLSHTLIHASDSPLELHVDPVTDPVAAGGRLVYELTFGNTGNAVAQDARLVFPVPAGTEFLAADGGSSFSNGQVSFDLGALAAHSAGRRRVEVRVPSPTTLAMVAVDAAEISAQVNFLPRWARAMAVSRIGADGIGMAAELQADPVAPAELIDIQVTLLNSRASATGSLSLHLLWPQELDSRTPFTTSGGTCVGSCNQGEYLNFNLGNLGPGASQIVSISEEPNAWPDGTIIPFEIELLEGSTPIATVSKTLILDATSPLELAIDPRADPVPAGSPLTYDISFGNNSAAIASNVLLSFPLPAGSAFVSATGDGHLAAGSVFWSLGALPANGGGRVQVTVRPPASPASQLAEVQNVRLTGSINSLPEEVRAAATSRVATVNRNLTLAVTPNPIDSNGVASGQITVSNPAAAATGDLVLRILWPDELDGENPTTTGGGACVGSCNAGELLTWNLGVLGPGGAITANFSEDLPGIARGTLIPFEAELVEGGFPARTRSQTLLVQATSPDTDGDGDPNALDPDDDNDGMPDTWESRYGLNPLNAADATQNPDGDGLVNRDEYRLGYNPLVADYVFADGFETGGITRWH